MNTCFFYVSEKKLLKKNEKGLYTYNISAWDYIGVTFANYNYAFTTLKKDLKKELCVYTANHKYTYLCHFIF